MFSTDREINIAELDTVTDFASRNRPAIVINCAGISRKDQAEENPIEAYRVNTLDARNLAIASESVGATIVHLSTDDLFFSGENKPVNEFDDTNPLSVYGKSNLAGEKFVRELNPRHVIVRSSWVYTDIPEDPIMRAIADAKRGIHVQAASNQLSSPTSAWSLVRLIGVILRHHEYGVFHATTQGTCSRVEFLEKVFEKCDLDTSLIDPVESNHPYHIELDNLMLKMTDIFTFPNWEEDLQQFIDISGLRA